MVDWAKPLQFENGQECVLVDTRLEGWTQWGARADGAYPTRHIRRLGIDESTMAGVVSANWFVYEDGVSSCFLGEGFNIINKS